VGSTTTILILGFLVLRYLPTPLTVPPDPDPATKISTLPAVSFHISGPDSSQCYKVTLLTTNYQYLKILGARTYHLLMFDFFLFPFWNMCKKHLAFRVDFLSKAQHLVSLKLALSICSHSVKYSSFPMTEHN
jgi:hypothetical protein